RHDRDQHRQHDHGHVVPDCTLNVHRGHPDVVHDRDADADDHAAGQHRPQSAAAVADDEQAHSDHDDRNQQADQGDRYVVQDLLTGDREADHGDEVHEPDAGGPDGHGRDQQPGGARPAGIGAGSREAPQAEESAQAGYYIAEARIQDAVRKVIYLHL